MPEQSRLSDIAKVPADAHGCPACPHPAQGPLIVGSPNVMVNGLPAARLNDMGIHMVCCGPNLYNTARASGTVFINGKGAVRKGDQTKHCGGMGQMIMGSPNVKTGG